MRRLGLLLGLLTLLGTALAAVGFRLDVDLNVRGIVLEPDTLVIGGVGGLEVVRSGPVRDEGLSGVAVVYNARRDVVVAAYEAEFRRVGWVRASRVELPRRTVYTFKGPDRTVRATFFEDDARRRTEVRVVVLD